MPDRDERQPQRRRRLAPGVGIFRLADRPVLRTASGQFFDMQVDVGSELGDLPPHAIAAFERQGLFAAGESAAPWPVAVVGTGLIATALVELLPRAGLPAEPVTAAELSARLAAADARLPAAVSWCCDGLPLADWCETGAALISAGVAWQRCSVEGACAVLEPVAMNADDVDHADVRGRRMAASESPEHLAAYWADEPLHAEPALGVVEAHLVAALLAAELVRCSHGGGLTRTLRLVDLLSQTVSDHQILPLPPVPARAERS
ncbi:hypothetical protein ACFXJ8_38785 [Nonomuraea sp. NPDC059194]|uniref:hypothetical protein n=1 Tax=Nonomuraea sp. NPDC059194 TaxID=3346764 RepID=UPI0036979C00